MDNETTRRPKDDEEDWDMAANHAPSPNDRDLVQAAHERLHGTGDSHRAEPDWDF